VISKAASIHSLSWLALKPPCKGSNFVAKCKVAFSKYNKQRLQMDADQGSGKWARNGIFLCF
jgi:hypothetical protein